MTSPRRFEQDLPGLLDDLYVAGVPDYRDDLVRQTAGIRQRPAWTFPERWLPMDLATRRVPFAAVPLRALIVLALILILAAAAVLLSVGSPRRVAPPFGPARNGPLAYMQADAIFARDTVNGPERVLIGSDGGRVDFAGFSPDGTQMAFSRTVAGSRYLFVADADGRGERKILAPALHDDAYIAWAPDSRTIAVSDEINLVRKVMLVHDDGSPPTIVDLGDASPTDMVWRPPAGAELLVRAMTKSGGQDFFLVRANGTLIRSFGLPSPQRFGSDWDNSGPAWSPNGAFLAYNRVEPLDGDNAHFRVHVIRADGSGDVAVPGPLDLATQEAWPLWSPDGKSIVVARFVFAPDGQGRLAILPADGTAHAREIGPWTHGEDSSVVKTWAPDGTRVVSYVRATGETFLIDPVTGKYEKAAWSAASEPDYRRLAP